MDVIEDTAISSDENDIFQCGRCKCEFNLYSLFKAHKLAKCKRNDLSIDEVISKGENLSSLDYTTETFTSKETFDDNMKNQHGVDANSILEADDSLSPLGKKSFYPNNAVQVISVNGIIHLTAPMDENEIVASVSNLFSRTNSGQTEHNFGDRAITSIKSNALQSQTLANILPAVKTEDASKEESISCNHELFHGSLAKSVNKTDQSKAKIKQKCCYCGREFVKNFDLQQHIRSHTGEKPFQCIVCGRSFAQKSNVKKHLETHKVWPTEALSNTLPKDPIKKVMLDDKAEEIIFDDSYVCYFCDMSMDSYIELKSHMKIHTDQKVYKCVQVNCEQTFEDMDRFMDHVQQHGKDTQYRCHTCSESFHSLESLGMHQAEHSFFPNSRKKAGESYLRCTKCLNKYSSMEALEYHLRSTTHHFPCGECGKVFSSERLLRRHLNVHGKINPIFCSTCKKEFKNIYTLKLHLLTHTGERPFKCQVCKAAFYRKDGLRRHMLIHASKKLKCPFRARLGCMLEFRRNDKLRRHLLSHVKTHKKLSSLQGKGLPGGRKSRKKKCTIPTNCKVEDHEETNIKVVATTDIEDLDQRSIAGCKTINESNQEETKKGSEIVLFEDRSVYEHQIQLIDDGKVSDETLSQFDYESGKKYQLVQIPLDHNWEARSLEDGNVVIHDGALAEASAIFSDNGEPFVASEIADLSLFVSPHVEECASIELTTKDVSWNENS